MFLHRDLILTGDHLGDVTGKVYFGKFGERAPEIQDFSTTGGSKCRFSKGAHLKAVNPSLRFSHGQCSDTRFLPKFSGHDPTQVPAFQLSTSFRYDL